MLLYLQIAEGIAKLPTRFVYLLAVSVALAEQEREEEKGEKSNNYEENLYIIITLVTANIEERGEKRRRSLIT